MRYFPIFLDFEGQRVLAVGGGEAILNKIRLLQRTTAAIELVAETLDDTLDGLVSHGAVAWVGRRFEPVHLDGVVAVFAAADDITNEAVHAAARARNVPVNVVDKPALSTFLTPAIVDRDNGLALFESGAIVQHIAESRPGLFPEDEAGRLRAIGWMFAALNTVEPPTVLRRTPTFT